MDKFDRFQLLHRLFRNHSRPISLARLAEKLECSEKTVKRAMESMRDYLEAPIEYFPEQRGWHYSKKDRDLYELPGLWLTSHELQSLALLLQLLETFGNGLLNRELGVIDRHIDKLLQVRGIARSAFDRHIKVLPLSNRYLAERTFARVCEAVLQGCQIDVTYTGFNRQSSRRRLSPQTLVYYRENWYLDAWCHTRKALRTFSLSRVDRLDILKEPATRVAEAELQEHFAGGYGIFAGPARFTARLRFFREIAREITSQQWHPRQVGTWAGDDYLLSIPYADQRELVQDILRWVPHVVVEAPESLRAEVQARLQAGLALFSES